MFGGLLEPPDRVVRGKPAGHRIQYPQAGEEVPIHDGRGVGRLRPVASGGGVQHPRVGGGGRGRRGVGRKPATQRLRASHREAVVGQVAVDDALQVGVQQSPAQTRRRVHDPGESAGDDRVGVIGEPVSAVPAHRIATALEEPRQRHRRCGTSAFRQRHGTHPQRQDPSRPAVGSGGVRRRGGSGEEVTSGRGAGIDTSSHRIPHLGQFLPLVEEQRSRRHRRQSEIRCGNPPLVLVVQQPRGGGAPPGGVRLPHSLGAVDRNGGSERQQLVQLQIHGPG